MSKLKFPTMLRKMWTGKEVQEWLDDMQEPSIPVSKLEELIVKCNKAIEAGESVGSNVMAYEMFRNDLQKLIDEAKR